MDDEIKHFTKDFSQILLLVLFSNYGAGCPLGGGGVVEVIGLVLLVVDREDGAAGAAATVAEQVLEEAEDFVHLCGVLATEKEQN